MEIPGTRNTVCFPFGVDGTLWDQLLRRERNWNPWELGAPVHGARTAVPGRTFHLPGIESNGGLEKGRHRHNPGRNVDEVVRGSGQLVLMLDKGGYMYIAEGYGVLELPHEKIAERIRLHEISRVDDVQIGKPFTFEVHSRRGKHPKIGISTNRSVISIHLASKDALERRAGRPPSP